MLNQYKAEYIHHKETCARYGFTCNEVTETGFTELRAIGFTCEDIYSIECDLQAGFTQAESIAAIQKESI